MMRFFLLLIGVVILVGAALGGSFLWDAYIPSPAKEAQPVTIEIPEGSSVKTIGQILADKKILRSPFFFKLYVGMMDDPASLQAGTYVLKPGMSFVSVVKTLSHAQANEVQVMFPEGSTWQQIGEELSVALPQISGEGWSTAVQHPQDLSDETSSLLAGIPAGQNLEGYLFPDTYRFRADANAKTVVQTMVLTLQRRLAENNVVVPTHLVMSNGMTLHEVLTLASIVEREVRSSEEMATVAGIFLKRLKIGMALQADSTVNFVTGGSSASASYKDIEVDSPYNTYKYLGLPPGPISNPGMNAISAVLQPIQTDYLYFLTDANGRVYYAKSFDEHVANKAKYLQ